MVRLVARRLPGAVLALCIVSAAAVPASASVCFTSGKVYVQQKVWDKAAMYLECARKLEPDNIQVYLLLGSARAELQQYASAGAAFEIGLQAARKKKDDKKIADLQNPKTFYMSRLYNSGVKAMSLVPPGGNRRGGGTLPPSRERCLRKWRSPTARSTGSSRVVPPGRGCVLLPAGDHGRSGSVDSYRNLSYVYDLMGRSDDAMAAARAGLVLAPDDARLRTNLRAAAVGQANRQFKAGKFSEAIPAYRAAIGTIRRAASLQSQIASAFYQWAPPWTRSRAERPAILDSAAVAYTGSCPDAPKTRCSSARTLTQYGVIYTNRASTRKLGHVLHEAVEEFPKNKDFCRSRARPRYDGGQWGAVALLKQAVAVNPKAR